MKKEPCRVRGFLRTSGNLRSWMDVQLAIWHEGLQRRKKTDEESRSGVVQFRNKI